MVRISDARMSGTAYGTIVLHCSPEAAVGGPLALVRDDDEIALDVAAGRLDLLVDDRGAGRAGARPGRRPSRRPAAGGASTPSASCRRTSAPTSTCSPPEADDAWGRRGRRRARGSRGTSSRPARWRRRCSGSSARRRPTCRPDLAIGYAGVAGLHVAQTGGMIAGRPRGRDVRPAHPPAAADGARLRRGPRRGDDRRGSRPRRRHGDQRRRDLRAQLPRAVGALRAGRALPGARPLAVPRRRRCGRVPHAAGDRRPPRRRRLLARGLPVRRRRAARLRAVGRPLGPRRRTAHVAPRRPAAAARPLGARRGDARAGHPARRAALARRSWCTTTSGSRWPPPAPSTRSTARRCSWRA